MGPMIISPPDLSFYEQEKWNGGPASRRPDIVLRQPDYATERRIPFLNSIEPRWPYIIGVVVGRQPFDVMPLPAPNEREVELIAHALERYKCERFHFTQMDAMKDFAPFDMAPRQETILLRKYRSGGWSYRLRHSTGPTWHFPTQTLGGVLEAAFAH